MFRPVSETEQAPTTRKKIVKSELRVPRYEGPEERAPVAVQRAVGIAGADVLKRLDDESGPPPLALPPGRLGEAEEHLGRADPGAALASVDDPSVPEPARSAVAARAALMAGDIAAARAALGAGTLPEQALADAMVSLAEGNITRALDRLKANGENTVAARYAWALVKVAEGDILEAQAALIDVARSAAWHAVARYQLGQLLLATGDPARAGTLFEMASIIAPSFLAPSLTLAEMLADSRQYGEALSLIQSMTERAPDAHAPRVLQLRILLEVGERDAALVLAEMLRDKAPDDMDVALLFAEALVESERKAEASAVLEDVVSRAAVPSSIRQRAHRLRARIALAERPARAEEALSILKSATALDGPITGELALELFHVAWALGKRAEAESALDAVERTDDASSLISGAILARSHALWDHARKLAEKARMHVAGSPAESQLDAFITGLP